MQQLTPRDLHAWLNDQGRAAPLLIDIREAWEVEQGAIAGSQHIPMAGIPAALPSLPSASPIVVYCQHGVRSMRVASFLASQGCTEVYNLSGGIVAWQHDVAAGGLR